MKNTLYEFGWIGSLACGIFIAAGTWLPRGARAADKPPEVKPAPQALLTNPLCVPIGASSVKVKVRGLLLDEASEVRFLDSPVTAKIVGKGKPSVPEKQKAKRVGDTDVVLEVTVPAECPSGEAKFVLVTPHGETPAKALFIEPPERLLASKEPNGSFRESQQVQFGQVIQGAIEQQKNVDVFRFAAKAGQKISCDCQAARHGSVFDPLLTLLDVRGDILAASDDTLQADGSWSADARIEFAIPADGDYFLSLVDAHDSAGPGHVYRLELSAQP